MSVLKDYPQVSIENYQKFAMLTCSPSEENDFYAVETYFAELLRLLASLKTYTARLSQCENNGFFFDKKIYLDAIKDKAGDCFWCIALCCTLFECEFSEIFNSTKPYTAALYSTSSDLDKITFLPAYTKEEQLQYVEDHRIRNKQIWIFEEISRIKGFCAKWDICPVECLKRNIANRTKQSASDNGGVQ